MELVYLLAWAIAVRANADVPGFFLYSTVVMAAYMVILLVGLIYEWKKGALTWT
jgi:NADH:ubiquinone oxidoreductase subunit 3 (subunit A)